MEHKMRWQDEYKKKLVSAEEAAKAVKSNETVVIPYRTNTQVIPQAIANRKNELRNVSIIVGSPRVDAAIFAGAEESFNVTPPTDSKNIADFVPSLFGLSFKAMDEKREGAYKEVDAAVVAVSPPDENGVCCFGHSLFHQKGYAKRAKKVLAEVNHKLIRTGGDNFIHVSEIDYFVEHDTPVVEVSGKGAPIPEFGSVKTIAQYIETLIKDGDIISLGAGVAVEPLAQMGTFDKKKELGYWAGGSRFGIIKLAKAGIMTGKYNNLTPGKIVASGFYGDDDDIAFMDNNPLFELYSYEYMNNPVICAQINNFVAINSIASIDLTGQWTVGVTNTYGAYFPVGSVMSKGGRSILATPSTSKGGTVSRIAARFTTGTAVTLPAAFGDYVVTEFGIARLFGKTLRQRAQELIAVAHPDFRVDLKKEAEKMYP
jgi:4-hydroxybutyrate CoA-transferase